ncbi:MAG: T9SS type A sorting domain-containing protein [Bacteroidota bacterium]
MRPSYLLVAMMLLSLVGLQAQPYDVTFQVDMSQESNVTDVTVAGSFQAAAGFPNDWTPGDTPLSDMDGDGVYTLTVQLPAGTYEYKFLNGTAWGTDEGVPGACAVNNNREMVISANTILPVVCFGSCDPCVAQVDTVNITFAVDLSNETPDTAVSVAGSFQAAAGFPNDWTPGDTRLTDPDGDMVYTTTVRLPSGTYQFKFVNGVAWGKDESIPGACNVGGNRELTVGSADDTVRFCYGTCDEICAPQLPPVNVTFQVDMNDEIVGPGGVFIAGNFQDPNWQKNLDGLSDMDGDGIYEFTVSLVPAEYEYKFFNGDYNMSSDPMNTDIFAETGNFADDGCGILNPFGESNRLLDLKGQLSDTTLPAYIFNTCQPRNVSIEDELNANGSLNVYPNPFSDFATLTFSNPRAKAYTITLSDLTGKVVRRMDNITGEQVEIEKGGLSNGIYMMTIFNAIGDRHTEKLIIQ